MTDQLKKTSESGLRLAARTTDSLFRKQVFEARQSRWLGSTVLRQSMTMWLLTSLAAFAAASIVLFLIFGEYTRRTRVIGQLVPSTGIATVNAPTAGILGYVKVEEGQRVQTGDVLAVVMVPRATQHGDTVDALQTAIATRLQSVGSGYASQREQLQVQKIGLDRQIDNAKAELRELEAELDTRHQQHQTAQQTTARFAELRKREFVTDLQYQEKKAEELDQLGAVQALERQRSSLRRQLAQIEQVQRELPSQLSAFNADEQRDRASLQQESVETSARAETVLRSPLAGTVATLLEQPGQSVLPGQPLMNLLPTESRLEAYLLVPSRAVGFIEPGDAVLLRYQAFPYQKFGHQQGRVLRISRNVLSANELMPFLGTQAGEPYYRIVVALNKQTVRAFGQDEPLKAGMLLEADLLGERRKLWEWAVEPLYTLDGSLAESEGN